MHTRHKNTTSACRNAHTSHTQAPTAPRVTIQTENTTSITPLTQTYNILKHSKSLKNTVFNNGRYTTNIPTDPHTVTTTDTRGNNLHHILAALKRYFPASLVAPLTNSEQINHPSSNHIYIKSTPKHIHHHYARSVTHTHTSALQLHPYTHHIVTPGFVDRPRRSDCTAGQMDGEAGWWATSGNIGLPPPPPARVKGVVDNNTSNDIDIVHVVRLRVLRSTMLCVVNTLIMYVRHGPSLGYAEQTGNV